MPYKPRMTNEEYLIEKAKLDEVDNQIAELKAEIKALREGSQKLRNRITWYERKDQQPMDEEERYKNSFCVKKFGKRAKDLTSEEKREYKRLQTQKCRAKRKAQNKYNFDFNKINNKNKPNLNKAGMEELRKDGLTYREIGDIFGLSKQRV